MFKEFFVKDLLKVEQTKSVVAKENLLDGNVPYVTRTVSNNGYTRKCGNVDKVNAGNCITIGAETGVAFYQPNDFVAGNKIYRLSREGLGEKEYLYLATILNQHTKDYSYSNARIPEKIKLEKISLPVDENGNINWQFMRDYIEKIMQKCTEKLKNYLKVTGLENYELTEEDKFILSEQKNFAEFKIEDIFERIFTKCKKEKFDKRSDTSTEPNEEFCIPLVNAKLGDNGIMFYGRKKDWETQSMCIDIIQNGAVATGTVYAQPKAVAVLWDAYLIKPIEKITSEKILLYLARCIEKIIKEKFSYDKKATWERVKECKIFLPINAEGKIDFEYMEKYICAIEKKVIADVVKYKNSVIETAKKVVGE